MRGNSDARASSGSASSPASLSTPGARPPLVSLETVCTVARQGSFLAAAEVAGLTHGAIGRRVAAVENWLGMTLFERHARGVRLTPDGQRFVGRIEQAFGIIDSAANQWRSPRSPRLVKLSVVPAFAKLWFFERQAALESEAPALRIELDIDHRNANIASEQADLAIRYGRGNWRQLEVKPFLPETLYPVPHPALAAQLAKRIRRRGDAACSTYRCCTTPIDRLARVVRRAGQSAQTARPGSPFRGLHPCASRRRGRAGRGAGAFAARRRVPRAQRARTCEPPRGRFAEGVGGSAVAISGW
jgi:DNA-binding transcriptional LysR family regulator